MGRSPCGFRLFNMFIRTQPTPRCRPDRTCRSDCAMRNAFARPGDLYPAACGCNPALWGGGMAPRCRSGSGRVGWVHIDLKPSGDGKVLRAILGASHHFGGGPSQSSVSVEPQRHCPAVFLWFLAASAVSVGFAPTANELRLISGPLE